MRNYLISKMTRERLDPFIAAHASSAYTLDIGCANSPYAQFFPNRIGFDVAPGAGVDVVGDAHLLPFPDETFEQILCTEVLEHLHTPQKALDEMRRVLKREGRIILTTRFIFPLHDVPGDYFRYTKYGLQHLLREWEVETLEEETDTVQTFSVLLQRLAFQTEVRGGRFTKTVLLFLARAISVFRPMIMKEYGVHSKSLTREEKPIMTSGYYIVARKS
jgi:SAM-dependent methyltransferase